MKITIIILLGIIIILSVLLFIVYRKLINFRKIKIVIKDNLTSLDSMRVTCKGVDLNTADKGCKTCRGTESFMRSCADCDAINDNFTEWKPKIGIDN